jgi:hypothetical protein
MSRAMSSRTGWLPTRVASRHDPMVRKFVIGSQGIVLDEVLPAAEDSPQGGSSLASVPSP